MDKCPHCRGSLKDVSLVELYMFNCPHCKRMVLSKREYEHLSRIECIKRNNELEKSFMEQSKKLTSENKKGL